MARIGDYIEAAQPVGPETTGANIYERFLNEPNTMVIPVVGMDNRPLGLIERNAFNLRMAAAFGRDLHAKRPVSALMNTAPLIARAEDSAEAFFDTIDSAEASGLLSGFIAVDGAGFYVGVGAILQVLQAGSALYRRRAHDMAELARGLARAEAEARASSRAKSEFLAVMSHEIRTPLNGVLGVAGLMQRKLTQDELRPHVQTILDSGQSLLRLLSDALDMSRAQAGVLTMEPAPMSLSDLVADLDALWRARAEEKGLTFGVQGPADDPWVEADSTRLKQLLNNLIGNAIKFTSAGSVTVRLDAKTTTAGVLVAGWVEDSGPGVSPETAETIFEPFNTGQAGRSGAGAGLGLAICRQIVDRMGGTIRVEAATAGGARFGFELTLPRAETVDRHAAPAMAEPTPHETLHVLVADDNAANRFLAGKLLELFGCTSDMVEDGRAAVEAVRARAYDLVLMDIKMPGMDGVEATRAIRALQTPGAALPILALTANADERDAESYLAAGMDGVVQKPIQPDVLLNAIRHALTPEVRAARAAA